jgi:hypothetical protein
MFDETELDLVFCGEKSGSIEWTEEEVRGRRRGRGRREREGRGKREGRVREGRGKGEGRGNRRGGMFDETELDLTNERGRRKEEGRGVKGSGDINSDEKLDNEGPHHWKRVYPQEP